MAHKFDEYVVGLKRRLSESEQWQFDHLPEPGRSVAKAMLELVKTVTYKPTWTFTVRANVATGVAVLAVSYEAKNADEPIGTLPPTFGPVKVGAQYPIPVEMFAAFLADDAAHANGFSVDPREATFIPAARRWLEDRIEEIEQHEFREWFRIGGVRVYDPHPEMAGTGGRTYMPPDFVQKYERDEMNNILSNSALYKSLMRYGWAGRSPLLYNAGSDASEEKDTRSETATVAKEDVVENVAEETVAETAEEAGEASRSAEPESRRVEAYEDDGDRG